jgi:hypothetical protein
VDPARELERRFGAHPTQELVRALWPTLRDAWLASDAASRSEVVARLQAAGLGTDDDTTTADGQLRFLATLSDTKTLRAVVLDAFLTHGADGATPVTTSAPTFAPAPTAAAGAAPTDRSPPWRAFERRLAEVLAALSDGESLVISAKDGRSFVQLTVEGPEGLRAETASETFLEPAEGSSDQQLAGLAALGWQPPTTSERWEVEPGGSASFSADFEAPVPFDGVAEMVVSTLVDVWHIAEPDELRYRAFDDGREILLPTLGLDRDTSGDDTGEQQESFEQVRRRVRDLVRELADSDQIDYDDDGDLVLRFGSAVVFVRVLEQPLLVRVLSPLLEDVDAGPALVERLNDLNAQVHFARLVLVGTTVWVAIDLFCMPLAPAHVAYALRLVGEVADELDDALQGEFGGKTFFGEQAMKPKAGYAGYL